MGCLGALLEDLVEIFGEVGAKMGPRWAQDGPSWQQVAPKIGHDGAKMAILASLWELLGSWEHFWLLFSRSLEQCPKCKNEQPSITFGGFLGVGASSGGFWRLSFEGFGGYVGRCWVQEDGFRWFLGPCVTFWWQASASNPSWVHLGWELGGWLGGLGAQGEPRTGGNPQKWGSATIFC